jgi:hypothetical protein
VNIKIREEMYSNLFSLGILCGFTFAEVKIVLSNVQVKTWKLPLAS